MAFCTIMMNLQAEARGGTMNWNEKPKKAGPRLFLYKIGAPFDCFVVSVRVF